MGVRLQTRYFQEEGSGMQRLFWGVLGIGVILLAALGGHREVRGQAATAQILVMSKEPTLLPPETLARLASARPVRELVSGHLKDQGISLAPSALLGMVSAQKVAGSSLVQITISGSEAVQAQRIANLLGVSLVEYRAQMQRKSMNQFRTLVDQELERSRKSLKEAEDAWVKLRKEKKGDTPEEQIALRQAERNLTWQEGLCYELLRKTQDVKVSEWLLGNDVEIVEPAGESR